MGRNWAIAIGVNQYYNLRPLKYAQQDAQAIRDFCLNEAGFERVYYFAEDAPLIETDYGPPLRSAPTVGNLERFLEVRFEQPFLDVGDNLWFFFAGHGKRYQGRDYLMPIDGSPRNVERTAISIRDIADRLRSSGADNVILMLDACRSEDDRDSGEGIGLEKQSGIVTLFSCSPSEAAYEIDELRQGSFTYALLQGLRMQGEGNCATVERLYQHLRYRVPALNRRYGKPPEQNPYAIAEPATKLHLILLPRYATLKDAETLKKNALRAEVKRDFQLARQFWIRVLAVSPADPEAIEGIERLSQNASASQMPAQPAPSSPKPQFIPGRRGENPSSSSPPSASIRRSPASPRPRQRSGNVRRPSPPSLSPLTRRRLLQIAGFSVAGAGAVVLGRTVIQSFESDVRSERVESHVEDLGNGVSLEMVEIPNGSFQMGSPENEGEDDERPQRPVTVASFSMGKYPVTQAQWKAVAAFDQVERELDLDPSHFDGDNRPVEEVSWDDAFEFCQRLSRKTEREYRLPSEAEWEYACRANTTTSFHFGETLSKDLANFGNHYNGTTEVNKFNKSNAFGLYDMHGNVYEWCLDHWHDNYKGAPTDGSAWVTDGDSSLRVLRGGSWDLYPDGCRSADRYRFARGFRNLTFGFRVVCASSWTP